MVGPTRRRSISFGSDPECAASRRSIAALDPAVRTMRDRPGGRARADPRVLDLDPVRIEIEKRSCQPEAGRRTFRPRSPTSFGKRWLPTSSVWWRWHPRSTPIFGLLPDETRRQPSGRSPRVACSDRTSSSSARRSVGTTAMADYLGQHPEVGMAAAKERHYFGSDLHPRLARRRDRRARPAQRQDWLDQRRDEYLELFAEVQDRRRLGEASVWYLYSSEAAAEIKEFSPEADIIAMLRNPLEMLPSLHSQFVHVGIEPGGGLRAGAGARRGAAAVWNSAGFPPHSYRSAVRYAEQLRRYLDVFGRDRVHVIIYDEFRDRTRDVYRGTCEFLGVDPSYEPELEVVNPNKEVRSRILRTLVKTPPEWARPLLHRLTTENQRRPTGDALTPFNTDSDAATRSRIRCRQRSFPEAERQVRELDELLGLDVSRWAVELLPGTGASLSVSTRSSSPCRADREAPDHDGHRAAASGTPMRLFREPSTEARAGTRLLPAVSRLTRRSPRSVP